MKKKIISLCLLVQVLSGQNNYGEFSYPHGSNSKLSSGISSTISSQPGFIMAGYDLNAAGFNFSIDRTDMGGAFTGSTYEFQKEYNIFADITGGCGLPNCTPRNSSHGVSIIQTPLSTIGARYALAGAFDEGCYLCFLNGSGSVINTNIFWFPFPVGTNPSTITKPLIKEDPFNLGYYYVCGSYSNLLYAMRVDYNGTVYWSYTYPISGQANDMTVSVSGDPVIVGFTSISNVVPDGFILTLAGSNGAVGAGNFKVYDYGNYYQSFSCISPASGSGTGYIIGGTCEVSPGNFKAYNLYTDAGGNQTWSNVIQCNADMTASNIVGIIERYSSFYNFEYFGVMTSTAGIIVSRMDDNGIPAWNGPPASNVSTLDEFVYNAPGVNLTAVSISTIDGLAYGYDDGLHIFGTNNTISGDEPYLAQSYFDGHSGCNTPGFHFSTFAISCTYPPVALTVNTGLSLCNAIYILDVPLSSKVNYCGPVSSIPNSSNQKPMGLGTDLKISSNDFIVITDPRSNKIIIDYEGKNLISEITINNLMGQVIYSGAGNQLNYEKGKLTCASIDIVTGIYIVTLKTDKGSISKKFNYSVD